MDLVIAQASTPGLLDDVPFNVHTNDGVYLGRIAQIGGKWIPGRRGHHGYASLIWWRVVTAGPRVPVDLAVRYATKEQAADAVYSAREGDTLHARGDDGLTPYERDVLFFEDTFTFVNPGDGSKKQAIWDLLELTETRYYQLLAHLINENHQAARAYAPLAVKRLLRRREARRQRRDAVRIGGGA